SSDLGTIPPPSTRLNSIMFVVMRGSFSDAIELILCGLLGFRKFPPTDCTDRAGATSSSTKVFHSLHPGHFPIHFADSYPHSCQTCFTLRFTNTIQSFHFNDF